MNLIGRASVLLLLYKEGDFMIGEKIKHRRLDLGLTLEQVGDSVGVGKSTVRRWENGMIKNIGLSNLKLLAKALGVSVEYLTEEVLEVQKDTVLASLESVDKLLFNTLPNYTQELSEITYKASKLDKTRQKLALKILDALLESDNS